MLLHIRIDNHLFAHADKLGEKYINC
jgi:hypothetical protein